MKAKEVSSRSSYEFLRILLYFIKKKNMHTNFKCNKTQQNKKKNTRHASTALRNAYFCEENNYILSVSRRHKCFKYYFPLNFSLNKAFILKYCTP